MSANRQLARALVDGLVAAGVERAVLSPGSRHTPLLMELLDRLRCEVVLDERAAGFLALGLARASERPVVLCCTSGSAFAHYLPAVIEARESQVGLVVLSADRPHELRGVHAPQAIHQLGGLAPWAQLEERIPAPAGPLSERRLRWLRRLALRAGRVGVAHLDICFRKPLWAPGPLAPSAPDPLRAPLGGRRTPGPVDGLCAALSEGPGVIAVGPLAPSQAERLAPKLVSLSQRLGWPLLADPASQLRWGPWGHATVTAYDALLRSERGADALLGSGTPRALFFGQRLTSMALYQTLEARAARCWIAGAEGEPHDPQSSATQRLEVDPELLLDALLAVLPAPAGSATPGQALERAARAVLDQSSAALDEPQIARQTLRLPAGCGLHLASSMPIRDVDSFGAPHERPLTVFVSRGANGIDGTIATAAGEALALERPLVLLVGDLATLHDLGGLLAAGQLGARIALTILTVDNGGGGIFQFLPIAAQAHAERFEHGFTTPQRADLAALCAGCGVRHQRIAQPAALESALAAALERPGVDLLELHSAARGAANVALHQAAWTGVGAAVIAADLGEAVS